MQPQVSFEFPWQLSVLASCQFAACCLSVALSDCLGIECIAFNIYLLLFFPFPSAAHIFLCEQNSERVGRRIERFCMAVRWKRKIKNAIAIKIA